MERSEARQRREQQKNLVEENRRLAKEQAAKLNHIDHKGTNFAFFGQNYHFKFTRIRPRQLISANSTPLLAKITKFIKTFYSNNILNKRSIKLLKPEQRVF